ncbi:MAG TPA: S8 family serine peptidase [Bacteroidales bacterium]|nr:S8 family serine peptidase [Bacteroidales bacterium]HNS46772.1 S8 family serine peptidase [Bacteroidales bacterium]
MKIRTLLSGVMIATTGILCALSPIHVQGQDYEPGRLFVCVYDTAGIPTFVGDTVIMSNDGLRELFNRYGVYSFNRAFPGIDTLKGKETYLLDQVYVLRCLGNEDSLLQELDLYSDWIYYYMEKIPVYRLIGNDNPPDPGYEVPPSTLRPPNDPRFAEDWALQNINAVEAWSYSKGDNILIGIPDGGFNRSHEDLKTQIHSALSSPAWHIYHGTVVAGCAGAATNNYKGKSSIGYNCKLILGSAPSNNQDWNEVLAMSNMGARVINASFISCKFNSTILNLIHYMADQGTLLVGGAGNGTEVGHCSSNGNGYGYPASYDPVISVTSVGQTDNHVYDGIHCHTHNDKVDVCAPGYGVLSTCYYIDSNGIIHNDCYSPNWGTSFAAPIVSGLAALVFYARSCMTPEEVKYIIESTTDDIYSIPGNSNFTGLLGHGRINAGRAVKKAAIIQPGTNVRLTSSATWTTEHYIKEYILVEKGVTLTILADVLFNTNARLIIKPGGTVVVNGATLRNNMCNGMWEGVQVEGIREKSQLEAGKHGKLSLINGATIKNARTGAALVNLLGDKTIHGGGGIIQAENAFFINNKIAVRFLPYENFTPENTSNVLDNVSYFKNVTFRTDDQLIDPQINPETFVILQDVRGIWFLGCSFVNNVPVEAEQNYFPSTRGGGIYSVNSSFTIDKLTPTSTDQCEFKYLYRGIEAYGFNSMKTFTVNETLFDSICKTIYLNGIDNVAITRNEIVLYDSYVFLPDMAYGVYLGYCTGYTVEENIIRKAYVSHVGSGPLHYGIVVSNSLDDNNFIYSNRMVDMNTGVLALGVNRGPGKTGLQIKCNEFLECSFDIVVSPDASSQPGSCGIAFNQGYDTRQDAPAGNRFGKDVPPWDNSDYNYHIDCGTIIYFHNSKSNSPPATWPSDYTSSTVTLAETQYEFRSTVSCPSWLELKGQPLLQIMKDAIYTMQNLATLENPTSELDYQFQIVSDAAYHLSQSYIHNPDTAFFQRNVELISLYEGITTNIRDLRSLSWEYRKVFAYLAVKDTVNADRVLVDIKAKWNLVNGKLDEYNDMVSYVEILKELIHNEKSIFEIDEAQKTILSLIARKKNSFVGAYARNILNTLGH